jgi:hypothetical protein
MDSPSAPRIGSIRRNRREKSTQNARHAGLEGYVIRGRNAAQRAKLAERDAERERVAAAWQREVAEQRRQAKRAQDAARRAQRR